MKKKFTKLLVFISAGTMFQTGLTAFAADAQIKAGTQSSSQPDARVNVQGNINEPAGAELQANAQLGQPDFARFKRATELFGTAVRNQQDEKLGDIKDVMVDLQSGQAPFAVISSGGFFGVGDRLLAVPTTTFAQSADQKQLVLNMDRAQLKGAPSFDKNSWPDMTDQTWSSQIYSYYGAQPAMESQVASQTTTTQTQINEAAGAESSWTRGQAYPERGTAQVYGETPSGLSPDRTPRQGLGAQDLTKNEAETGGYVESAGAERPRHTETTTTEKREMRTERQGALTTMPAGKVNRASDLIGMEVKNAQNERIGEIKDVVIDMHSGRVAYTVLDAGGLLTGDNKLYAVPPTVFTRSSDERSLVFNTDKETLKTAPSFEKNNWPQADQQFTTEVYRFYHQQPYWQSSRQIQEPSGSQPMMKHHEQMMKRDSSGEWQKGTYNKDQTQPQIQEPSGAAPVAPAPGAEINQPQQAEPERNLGPNQSSATKETSELQSTTPQSQQPQVQEPSGAQPQVTEPSGTTTESTAPATSEDQAASATDRKMSQELKTALSTDTVLSPLAEKVNVSAANGKITLRGTVDTEQQKQSIAAKAQQIAGSADNVDNQIKVGGESTNP